MVAARAWAAASVLILPIAGGCGAVSVDSRAPLFGAPLSINGRPIGPAVIDTGGAFEVLLRDASGLPIAGRARVLAFGGLETVEVTRGFDYVAGGFSATAPGALVGLSACDCNGLGFHFFRKTGAILEIDFSTLDSAFLTAAPPGDVTLPFQEPPDHLPNFDSAFVEVEITANGVQTVALALLDTGAAATTMRRKLVGGDGGARRDDQRVTITHALLGTLSVQVGLFDTEGLPDVILGTDVMRTWADKWYFEFDPTGGSVTVVFAADEVPESPGSPTAGITSLAVERDYSN